MGITTAEKIRIILRRNNMTVADLARATNQSRQNLSNKLSSANFSEKEINRLANGLGCTVDIVFTLPDGTKV